MIDWKISVGGILVLLFGVWLTHRLSSSRSEREEYKRKVSEFKEMLVPFLKDLESVDAHPPALVSQQFPKQDEAARKLMLYMNSRQRRRFLERWERYAAFYREKQAQGIAVLIATEVDDISKAKPGSPEAERYVFEQTTKRRIYVRDLIQDSLSVL